VVDVANVESGVAGSAPVLVMLSSTREKLSTNVLGSAIALVII
jgi:hypothetical protein